MTKVSRAEEWKELCRSKRYRQVVEEFNQLTNKNGLNLQELLPLSYAMIETRQFDSAEAILKALFEKSPQTIEISINYSFLLMRKESWKDASTFLQNVTSKYFTNSPKLFWNLGLSLAHTNKTPEAMQALEKSLKFKPKWIEPQIDLALLKLEQKDFKGAELAIQEALQWVPTSSRAKAVSREIKKSLTPDNIYRQDSE